MKPPAPVVLLALTALVAGCSSPSDGSSATPSSVAEPSVTPPSDGTNVDAFCALVQEGRDLETDMRLEALSIDLSTALTNALTDVDPAAIAAIHAFGSAYVEGIDGISMIYERLLDTTDDPVLEQGIQLSIDFADFGSPLGAAMVEVTTLSEYTALMNTFSENMTALLSDPADQEATVYLDAFSVENCGYPISTSMG